MSPLYETSAEAQSGRVLKKLSAMFAELKVNILLVNAVISLYLNVVFEIVKQLKK